ncbi:unnamed protein product [Blepharisma stoltei]|uniref:Uncharacterized protein n=1 Tax=Blepharisma stoltei TaxID=1481888 RepID=A0AAU9IK45_9CILI|nr:unnamed protein product [Blepharisma stoltei]
MNLQNIQVRNKIRYQIYLNYCKVIQESAAGLLFWVANIESLVQIALKYCQAFIIYFYCLQQKTERTRIHSGSVSYKSWRHHQHWQSYQSRAKVRCYF